MKSLLKKELLQAVSGLSQPKFPKAELRKQSGKKNRSKGQLKRLRNELYRKRNTQQRSWKTFPSRKSGHSDVDKHSHDNLGGVFKVDAELIKLGKQINQARRQVFEATQSRAIGKKTESILFKKDYKEFKQDLKTLICT
ncbi:unnamed protein product [Heterobilharzia americana]|nr:unnamed protein product [Heterobilharzia americana]